MASHPAAETSRATSSAITLTARQLAIYELLAGGGFGPSAYLTPAQAEQRWPGSPQPGWLPVLQVAASQSPAAGDHLRLLHPEGVLLGTLTVASRQPVDDDLVAVSGDVAVAVTGVHYDHTDLRRSPKALAAAGGPHLAVPAGEPLGKRSLADLAALARQRRRPVLLQTLVGDRQADDYDVHTLIQAHRLAVAGLRARSVAVSHVLVSLPAASDPAGRALQAEVALASGAADVIFGDPDTQAAADLPPDVADLLQRRQSPPWRSGVALLMTGLSGSGKSTIAGAVMARIHAVSDRRVTLLDGDLVRTHLSSELGFSRHDRDLNVTRIGAVAAEVVKHGGVAICAPIAPYAATRETVRQMVQRVGTFLLIHIATPVEVCEARDRKGLYAKARAGEIAAFTGISDPYDVPEDADLRLDTTDISVDTAASAVLALLEQRGLLHPPASGAP